MFRATRLPVAQRQPDLAGAFQQLQIALGRLAAHPRAVRDLLGGERAVGAAQGPSDELGGGGGVALGESRFVRRPQCAEEPVHLRLFGLPAPVEGLPQGRVRLQLRAQPRVRERLHQVLERAVPHRVLHGRDVPGGRHHDHVDLTAEAAQFPYDGEAVSVGQVVVQQDQVHRDLLDRLQRRGGRVGLRGHPEAGDLGDVRRVDLRHPDVVVHDQDLDHGCSPVVAGCVEGGGPSAKPPGSAEARGVGSASASGSTTVNTAPPPSAPDTVTLPP